jgi:L-asparaginase
MHQDMEPSLINASYAAGAQGIVFAGTGAGSLSTVVTLAAEELFNATGLPMVRSHRSADGFVPSSVEEFTIAGGFHNPQKTRIFLQLALTAGYGYDEIKEAFALGYPAP